MTRIYTHTPARPTRAARALRALRATRNNTQRGTNNHAGPWHDGNSGVCKNVHRGIKNVAKSLWIWKILFNFAGDKLKIWIYGWSHTETNLL